MIDRLLDIVLYRFTNLKNDSNDNIVPQITTGTIVFGALIRFFFLTLLCWGMIQYFYLYDHWFILFMIIMGLTFYPAYRQWEHFHNRVDEMQDSTLCGSCKHFEPSGQLCRPLDEHVSNSYIPCDGQSWEPKFIEIENLR